MSEIIPIVNRQDEIIKYKERGSESGDDIGRISSLWLVNSKKQILLAQRSFNKKYSPGKWGPAVSGTIVKGESYLENVIKETKEEIGISLAEYNFKEIDKIFTKTGHSFFCQWYFLQADIPIEELIFPKDEVEQLKWMDKDKFEKDLARHPENYTVAMRQHYEKLRKYF